MQPNVKVLEVIADVFIGRTGAIDFEPITTAILSHWKQPEIDWESVVLSQLNEGQAQSGMGFKYHY